MAESKNQSRENTTEMINSLLFDALLRLYNAAPSTLNCNDFHHSKKDVHSHSENCNPLQAYNDALENAKSIIELGKSKVPAWKIQDSVRYCGLSRYLTQAQYDANPKIRKWYDPITPSR